MEIGPFIVDFPWKMVIFHSYVSLPESIFSEKPGTGRAVPGESLCPLSSEHLGELWGPRAGAWEVETHDGYRGILQSMAWSQVSDWLEILHSHHHCYHGPFKFVDDHRGTGVYPYAILFHHALEPSSRHFERSFSWIILALSNTKPQPTYISMLAVTK